MKEFCAKCRAEKYVIFDFDGVAHCQKCGDVLKVKKQEAQQQNDFKLSAAGESVENRTRENTPDWYESGELMD